MTEPTTRRNACSWLPLLGLTLAACSAPAPERERGPDDTREPATVRAEASVRAEPRLGSSPSDTAILPKPGPTGGAWLFAALGEDGLAWYDEQGRERGRLTDINVALVEVLDGGGLTGMPAADSAGPLLAVAEGRSGQVSFHRFDLASATLQALATRPIEADDEITGLCHDFSPLSRSWQLFIVTDAGQVHHWALPAAPGGTAEHMRTLPAGKGAGHCAVDSGRRMLYLVHETLGVWRTDAEPESEPAFEILAFTEPQGQLGPDLKGIALAPAGEERAWLLVSDVENGRIAVLDSRDGAIRGALTLPGLQEAEGLAMGLTRGGALLALADEENAPGGRAVSALDWSVVAAELGLEPAYLNLSMDQAAPAVVRPVAETDPVTSHGDAADDPAIWVHPDEPAASLVLGTDKQGGIHLYDLEGKDLAFVPAGRINNIDLRDGFDFDGSRWTLVAGSDRSRHGVSLFLLDGPGRRLVPLPESFIPTDLSDPYGLCLFHSGRDGSFQVIVNDALDGRSLQFRVQADGRGGITYELLREIPVGAQAEGCVVDDENSFLFIAEEEHGIWRYPAEAADGLGRLLIDSVDGGRLVPDVEGLGLWKQPGGGGYLVASNQGNDSFLLYERSSPHAFVGEFFVVAGGGMDGASETDGLEVTSIALGPAYPEGLVVVQDGRNLGPRERQNFKYLSWRDIARALSLQ